MRSKFNSTLKLEISSASVHSKLNYITYQTTRCSEESLSLSFIQSVFTILKSTMETETEGEQLFSLCRADTFQLGKLEAVQPACHRASPRLTRPAVPSKHLPLIFPLSLSIPSAPSLNYPKDRSNLKVPVQWDQEEQRVGRIRKVHPGGMFRGRLSGVLAGRCTKLPVLWYQASAGCNPLVQAKKTGNIME